VHASRKEDRRLSAALLAAALAHTPEAEEALRGARTRMARKPAALARELLRNFPKGRRGNKRRRRKSGSGAENNAGGAPERQGTKVPQETGAEERSGEPTGPMASEPSGEAPGSAAKAQSTESTGPTGSTAKAERDDSGNEPEAKPKPARRRSRSTTKRKPAAAEPISEEAIARVANASPVRDEPRPEQASKDEPGAEDGVGQIKRRRRPRTRTDAEEAA
jgi:hypothetical protein